MYCLVTFRPISDGHGAYEFTGYVHALTVDSDSTEYMTAGYDAREVWAIEEQLRREAPPQLVTVKLCLQ